MRSFLFCSLVWVVASSGCYQDIYRGGPFCTEGTPIDAEVTFTAAEVLAAAAFTQHTETTPIERFPDPMPVEDQVQFALAGEPVVVDLDDGLGEGLRDYQCPTGIALRVPVEETRFGTVNGWTYHQVWTEIAILATGPTVDEMSVIELRTHDRHDHPGTVDDPLLPPLDPCPGEKWVWAFSSHEPWAGAWAEVRDRASISGECHHPNDGFWGGPGVAWGDEPDGW